MKPFGLVFPEAKLLNSECKRLADVLALSETRLSNAITFALPPFRNTKSVSIFRTGTTPPLVDMAFVSDMAAGQFTVSVPGLQRLREAAQLELNDQTILFYAALCMAAACVGTPAKFEASSEDIAEAFGSVRPIIGAKTNGGGWDVVGYRRLGDRQVVELHAKIDHDGSFKEGVSVVGQQPTSGPPVRMI